MTTEATSRLLDVLRIEIPIVNAPMARIAGGALAGAVTAAGGLGFVGGGYGDLRWIDEQLTLAAGRRVGIGVITWTLDDQVLAALVDRGVREVWLSFGDPASHVRVLHDAGSIAICFLRAAPGCASKRSVRAPHWASTWAMPRPMVPAPATPAARSLREGSSMGKSVF